jgi:hypothetical protein
MSITREQLIQPGAVFRAKLSESSYCPAGTLVVLKEDGGTMPPFFRVQGDPNERPLCIPLDDLEVVIPGAVTVPIDLARDYCRRYDKDGDLRTPPGARAFRARLRAAFQTQLDAFDEPAELRQAREALEKAGYVVTRPAKTPDNQG